LDFNVIAWSDTNTILIEKKEISSLKRSITCFLKASIARGGTSLGDGLQNFVSVSTSKRA